MRAAIPVLLFVLSSGTAEIIDRIAVTVNNNRVITESEIFRQIRLTAFLNGEKPGFSAENKRRTADRLVEQALIRREIETGRYVTASGNSKTFYEQLVKRYKDQAAYQSALAEYKITDEEVRAALEWQATLLEFVAVRFRPGVQVPESEVRDYYDTEIAPKAAASKEKVSFEDARENIEEILIQQRVDNALDRWLGQARNQSRIRYRQEVLR